MTDPHSLGRVIGTALDDVRVTLPARTRARFVERVTELLEFDREQRHQARRERTYNALRHEEWR